MSSKVLVFIVLITSFLQQCNQEESELFPALEDDKYGYLNKEGRVVITPQFQDAKEFKSGLARVKLNDKWGFINKSGDFVIPPKFNAIEDFNSNIWIDKDLAGVILDGKYYCIDLNGKIVRQDLNYFEGLAKVEFGKKFGFIDSSRIFIIEPQFEEAGDFSESLAEVKIQNKYGYINMLGKIVINPSFTFADDFSEGLAFVKIDLDKKGLEERVGFIDKSGEFQLILTQDNLKLEKSVYFLMTLCSPFSEGLSRISAFKEGGLKYGLIDRNGRLILEVKYDYISHFSEGLAGVKRNQKFGYIDRTGKFVIAPKFDLGTDFKNGKASVSYEGNYFTIDSLGRFVIN